MRALSYITVSFFTGLVTVYGFAPYRLYWLLPISLAILAELVHRYPARAFLIGYFWGLGAYLAHFYWIFHSLYNVAGLPIWLALPITALLPIYLALYPGLASWISSRINARLWVRWALIFPAAWTLAEWLRGWMLTGLAWGQVGYSQITESPLAGFAATNGIYAVTFAVALSSGLLMVLTRLNIRARIAMLLLGALLWSSGGWLKEIQWTVPFGKPFTVALAQGNIAQNTKWNPSHLNNALTLYYKQVAATHADLMILPETALPLFLDDLSPGYLNKLINRARLNGMALATGIPLYTEDRQSYLNAVVDLTTDKIPYYAKNHLVPFGEFIPFKWIIGWIYQFMNMPLSDFASGGTQQAPLEMAGQKVAFNICYEDSFGEELIASAAHATILANVSNLGWFGNTEATSQHLQISQARALETGRFILRATNTGMTAIVRPDGEIASIAAPSTTQVLTGFAEGRTGNTPYMQYGNLPILAFTITILLITTILGWKKTPPQIRHSTLSGPVNNSV